MTAYGVVPTLAMALTIVMGRDGLLSLFVMVHVTTCAPSLQTVSPERIGWCAHAGNATTITPTTAMPARTTARLAKPLEPRNENRESFR